MTQLQGIFRFAIIVAALCVLSAPDAMRAQTSTQRPPVRQRTVPRATAPPTVAQPTFKGIWEPVNYPDDLVLTSVFFVSERIGWIAGHGPSGGGFVLHTADAGEHWVMQLGDPKSNDPEISALRFLDARHGWAMQKNKILRTSDGANWEDAGTLPQYVSLSDYSFTSPAHGVFLGGNPWPQNIFVTEDGGRTWKQVFKCETRIEVNGLMVNTGCTLVALRFATPSVGYAVGGSLLANAPYFFTVAKTEDGGKNWRVVYTSDTTVGHAESAFFQDESNGVTKNTDGKFYRTADGGLTWTAAMGDAKFEDLPLFFCDPQVGWSGGARQVSFTLDGGAHWSSRNLGFPADVLGFSFPSRNRGYAVGWHGMIYRYSVVPFNYRAAARSIEAPPMPGYDSPVFKEVATMKEVMAQLQAKLPASVAAQGGAQTLAQGAGQGPGQAGGQSGGFQQDTSTGPVAGGYMDSCCGPLMQQLETTVNSFATDAPAYSSRFRNLNMVLQGLSFLNSITGQANTLKQSIRTLRQAANPQAASAAFTTVQTQFNGISSAGGFVQDVSTPPQP